MKRHRNSSADSILLLPLDLEGLRGFLDPLNTEFTWIPTPTESGWVRASVDYRPVRAEVRRLVQVWFDNDRDVGKLFQAEPVLAREARRFNAQIVAFQGRARLIYLTAPEDMSPADPAAIAIGLFLDFLLSPYNEKLGGPCRHCDKYFVKRTLRQTTYCSKQCGLKHTSKAAIQKRRQGEHKSKLVRAQKALEDWTRTRPKKDWKDWVAGQIRISRNFLTRAAKSGELSPPGKPINANRQPSD